MRNLLPLESLKQIQKGEAALGCCLEARDALDDFRKRPEHISHRDSNMELLPLLMCGRVQRHGFIFSPFPLSSQESLNRSVGGVVPSSGKQSSSVIQGQVLSPHTRGSFRGQQHWAASLPFQPEPGAQPSGEAQGSGVLVSKRVRAALAFP